MSNGARDLAALPKGHLHLHLEAAMRPATLEELAAEHGVTVPEIGAYGDFSAFEATYEAATEVLRREEDVERLMREMLEDARPTATELVLDGLDRWLGEGERTRAARGDRLRAADPAAVGHSPPRVPESTRVHIHAAEKLGAFGFRRVPVVTLPRASATRSAVR